MTFPRNSFGSCEDFFVDLPNLIKKNMDIPRELVYEDKTSLDDFGINEEGLLNQVIYDEWLLTRKELRGDDHRILKVFNDAYFLCTMAFVKPNIKLKILYCLHQIEFPSVVVPLVRFYLSGLSSMQKGTKRFWTSLEGVMEEDWIKNLEALEKVADSYRNGVSKDFFIPRQLTVSLLSGIEWQKVTDDFDTKTIEEVVKTFAKNHDEWCMMVEAIKAAAKQYDYDFGFEEDVYEGCDENGPYEQIIRVPKDPYDYDGNERILEPLKHAGVYQFCDELMEKYAELVVFVPVKDLDKVTMTEQIQRQVGTGGSQIDTIVQNSCFKFENDFVKEQVSKVVNDCYQGRQSNLALIEVAFFDHGLLKKRNDHKVFILQLISWGVLNGGMKKDVQRIANGMSYKMSKLPKDGYKTWSNDLLNERKRCEDIADTLGTTIPYQRL